MHLVNNAANYFTMLETGFETVASLVEACNHHAVSYRSVNDAVSLIETLEPVP